MLKVLPFKNDNYPSYFSVLSKMSLKYYFMLGFTVILSEGQFSRSEGSPFKVIIKHSIDPALISFSRPLILKFNIIPLFYQLLVILNIYLF